MTGLQNSKVIIRAPDRSYLTGGPTVWEFTADSLKATVLDYETDRVAEQLELVRRTHGITLEAVPLDPKLTHEICDRCEQLMVAPLAFFDGTQFLCPDCRAHPTG